ncbi:MAG: LacI family DNA-binding transcriptional regulator [Phycisphaeraceae bacterium]|nr:LacI family DNA-binding transcriptional regulator [Phycisphaeraceae bacterium]
MKKKYTIKDVAQRSGVGVSTVSRVLNNYSTKIKVSERTRQKIFDVVKELDYMPNIHAKRLSQNKSMVIGLEVPSSAPGYVHAFADTPLIETMRGIEEAISKTPYRLLLSFKNKQYIDSREYLQLFRESGIDGLIVWGCQCADNYDKALFDYPVVFANTYPDTPKEINFIGHDNFNASRKQTQDLIDQGCKKFIYLSGPLINSISIELRNGFLQALQEAGIAFDETRDFEGDFCYLSGFELMNQIITEGTLDFDAVVTANTKMAAGVFDAAQHHHRQCPADFALVGGRGSAVENNSQIPFFEANCLTMGRLAIEKLQQLIDKEVPEKFKILIDTSNIEVKNAKHMSSDPVL